ncbi:MAG: ATPase [Glaciimonas sp.]|nr:ATPase [Glaciimonas sp.]
MKISIQVSVNSSLEKVWSAWISPDDINQWNAASDEWYNPRSSNDLRIGGKFSYRMEAKDGSFGFDFEGTYTKVEQFSLIEYALEDGRTVSIQFTHGSSGVKVVETFDAEDENSAEQQKQGWQCILNRFAKHVESKQ